MTALLIIIAALVLLFAGYVFYGAYLAKQWGIDPKKSTPANFMPDGVDYVETKPAVLMGHHFSSIAGAGPINSDHGRGFWLGSCIFVVRYWRYFLWRFAGLRLALCLNP